MRLFKLVPFVPIDGEFFYHYDSPIPFGSLVSVPFGVKNTEVFAICIEEVEYKISLNSDLLGEKMSAFKTIINVLKESILTPNLYELVKFLAAYNLEALGSILRICFPLPKYDFSATRGAKFLRVLEHNTKLTPAQIALIEAVKLNGELQKKQARQIVSASIIETLIKKGVIEEFEFTSENTKIAPQIPALNSAQNAVFEGIVLYLDTPQKFNVILFEGVTGSGKTEVYASVLIKILQENPQAQVLICLPEIGLTNALVERFERIFGQNITVWNSLISDGQRRENFKKITNGEGRIVLGTRSAIMLPFKNLQFAVIDEEHDHSYKQEEVISYHARDAVIMRAKIENFGVLLVSATPSIESEVNALAGKYKKVQLFDRFAEVLMPKISLIDLRKHKPAKGDFISPVLYEQIKQTVGRGKQVLLFINRRGYAPIVVCRECGDKIKCFNCDVSLTEHRSDFSWRCHKCDLRLKRADTCKACGAVESFQTMGLGIEKIREELMRNLPKFKTQIISSDTVSTAHKLRELFGLIESGFVDVILGTQIIAKGFHFKNLHLVGVLDADSGMFGEDFRGLERTYQMLTQVSGRAGREGEQGEVFIQTYEPDNNVLKAIMSYDRDKFYHNEVLNRKNFKLPPFSRQIGIVVSAYDMELASTTAVKFSEILKETFAKHKLTDITAVFGPAAAPISFIRKRFRFRILINTPRNVHIQPILKEARSLIKLKQDAKIKIDIDPTSFY
jgi:primosomal protein N' (replication factor Y)